MKIVIVIEGGCLRSVYCDEDAEVELIDLDSDLDVPEQDIDARRDDIDRRLAKVADDMIEVF